MPVFNPAISIVTLDIGDAIPGATEGSVLFAGASGVLAQDNANLFWDDTNNRLGIGTAPPASKLHLSLADAGTNAVVTVETVDHITSGAAANGFGAGRLLRLEDDGGTIRSAAQESVLWATAAAGTRKARRIWSVFDTAEREGLRLDTDGTVAYVSILGNPPASATLSKLGLGSAIAGGDSDGTYLGINAASGYTGTFLDFQVNGTRKFEVNHDGEVLLGLNTSLGRSTIFFGGRTTSFPALQNIDDNLFVFKADLTGTLAPFHAGNTFAHGIITAIGPDSQVVTSRRDNNAMAWAFYSDAGNLQLYDYSASVDRLTFTVSTGVLTHRIDDAATNTATVAHNLTHNSSGTPAAGFGSELRFQLESSTTPNQNASAWRTLWATATDASRKADVVGIVWDTAEREWIRGRANGSAPEIAVLAGTPQGVQTVDAAAVDPATTMALVNQIRAAFIGFGYLV